MTPPDTYAATELRQVLEAGPDPSENFFRLKVTGNIKGTKWLNVTPDQLEAIVRVFESGPDQYEKHEPDPGAGPWTVDDDGVSVLNRHGSIVYAAASPEDALDWVAERPDLQPPGTYPACSGCGNEPYRGKDGRWVGHEPDCPRPGTGPDMYARPAA